MINTEIIEEAVELAIWSTAVKRERGVSIMLVAPAEHGKTEVLKKFWKINSVKMTSDFNTYVFMEFANEYMIGRKKTLVIPDFLRVVLKKSTTQGTALTIMNAITEEGWTGKLPLGQPIDKPIKANVITSLTQDTLLDKRRRWGSIGFLSRFVPLTYSYLPETKQVIREYIKNRTYHQDEEYDFEIPEKDKKEIKLPKDIANQIEQIALNVRLETSKNLTGFRLQKQLQTLAMASALKNERSIVNDDDVEIIKKIANFINFDFKKI